VPGLGHDGADLGGADFESNDDVFASHVSERGKVW
jgi:hypothetical protein